MIKSKGNNNHKPCLPINIVAKYIKQKLLRECSNSAVIIGDFNIPFQNQTNLADKINK